MSCGRYVSTGLGPVSSAVGMFEPVTTTRSTSAVDGAAAPGSAGTAGAGNCPNAFDASVNGNPTPAIKARRTNLNVFSAFCVISCFSFGCEGRVSFSGVMALGHKSGSFGHNRAGFNATLFDLLGARDRGHSIDYYVQSRGHLTRVPT